ncbi:SigE family RNA polymerase sigma factor [Phytoactinopolyspora limicola]|uniref:SigE family RNA polymerase sigma factor n=1 Tax=Phytoactinopolyspora limicola TaxID=2715536 RepID=UPI001A9C5F1D|nr:SigE family RNA polymerase sigma factor [Phytoactinopolyspora limicola]
MAQVEDGFRDFAVACGGPLFRSAWWLTGDWHLAEDLVQETLGKMYRRWRGPESVDNPMAYAHTVLVRTYLAHRRRRSSAESPAGNMPDSPIDDGDVTLRMTLMAGLNQLHPRDRAVLVLRYWEDRSVDDTATVLGISAGAVKSRSFRALQRLRELLRADLGDLSALQ